ncbi:kinase-like domain-containing protein [Zopfochytrium polystomum]|nr:kinase-like domain-containing protein [Zopfochytrium polystomum]
MEEEEDADFVADVDYDEAVDDDEPLTDEEEEEDSEVGIDPVVAYSQFFFAPSPASVLAAASAATRRGGGGSDNNGVVLHAPATLSSPQHPQTPAARSGTGTDGGVAPLPEAAQTYPLVPDFYKQYQLKYPLGVGGTSFVFCAARREDGLNVAVKFLFKDRIPPDGWKRDRSIGMVPIEAFILRKLNHPNIVKFYDIFEDRKFIYLVMEAVSPIGQPSSSPQLPRRKARPFSHNPAALSPNSPPLGRHSRHVSSDAGRAGRSYSAASSPVIGSHREATFANLPHFVNSLPQHSSIRGPQRGGPLSGGVSLRAAGSEDQPSQASSASSAPSKSLNRLEPPALHDLPHLHHLGLNKRRRSSHDLFDCIERNPYISEPTVRHLFLQIAEAVHHMHSKGFCHRDLKDENVIVDGDLSVRVIDFGAARPVASSLVGVRAVPIRQLSVGPRGGGGGGGGAVGGMAGSAPPPQKQVIRQFMEFVGSKAYISPEILRGEMYGGFEHDVWCLGVLLFVLSESKHPFPDTPHNPRTQRPHLQTRRSEQCVNLLDRLLEPDPSRRIVVGDVLRHEWMAAPLEGVMAARLGVDGRFLE